MGNVLFGGHNFLRCFLLEYSHQPIVPAVSSVIDDAGSNLITICTWKDGEVPGIFFSGSFGPQGQVDYIDVDVVPLSDSMILK